MAEAVKQKISKADKQVIKQYLKEVRGKLICPLSMKSVFLGELKGSVLEYAENKENVTIEALYEEFGSPAEIADGFLDRTDYQELLKKAKKKLLLWRVISVVLLVLVIIIVLYFIKVCDDMGGTYTITEPYDPI